MVGDEEPTDEASVSSEELRAGLLPSESSPELDEADETDDDAWRIFRTSDTGKAV